jgi:hypothetical protein
VIEQITCTAESAKLFEPNFPTLLGAACCETFATENWSSARRFERHVIALPALIAGYLETLALAAGATASPAKVCAPGVPASFAAFGLAQISFRIIFLLTLCERKGRAALGTSDLNVWHLSFSPGKLQRGINGFPSRRRAWRSRLT